MDILAVVMCGGKGSRLGYIEKPMIFVSGKRLIDFAIWEIERAMLDALFVTSPYTPHTEEYLRSKGMEIFRGKGAGYIEDLFLAVKENDIVCPVLTLNSDLYIARRGIVSEVVKAYMKSSFPAMSCIFKNGKAVGINILDPILGEQDEEKFIINESDVINIDTFEDIRRAENGRVL